MEKASMTIWNWLDNVLFNVYFKIGVIFSLTHLALQQFKPNWFIRVALNFSDLCGMGMVRLGLIYALVLIFKSFKKSLQQKNTLE